MGRRVHAVVRRRGSVPPLISALSNMWVKLNQHMWKLIQAQLTQRQGIFEATVLARGISEVPSLGSENAR